jgi:hypothetical protein
MSNKTSLVSFVLTQESDNAFYLRPESAFEVSGGFDEIESAITSRIIKYMERAKKLKWKTNFKFSRKFYIDVFVDGKKVSSSDVSFQWSDSGDSHGSVSMTCKNTNRFVDTMQEIFSEF